APRSRPLSLPVPCARDGSRHVRGAADERRSDVRARGLRAHRGDQLRDHPGVTMRQMYERITRRHLVLALVLSVLMPPLGLLVAGLCMSLPAELATNAGASESIVIVDRDGRVLREARADD